MHRLKKKWFLGVPDLTLITPSQWLNNLVKQSFLKDYPAVVINNGIDLDVFKPTASDFREKYRLDGKKIVLGVSFGWGYSKGLDVFVDLANRLPEDYQVVLVGTNDDTDRQLPDNIISIHQTQNQAELAEIYSAADVFVNPTREDNYPTVNMESLACGTPVVTFRTGGSPEIIDETCGSVVPYNDTDAMLLEILRVCEDKIYPRSACIEKSKSFKLDDKFSSVVEMYFN
jgi:glycosyltransferase involved in cell wall biosynthesis